MADSTEAHPLHPSRKAILRASALALIVAAIILVLAVLPAEYGVDITGGGKALGFTQMNAAKIEQGNIVAFRAEPQKYVENTVELQLAPGQGYEYKFRLKQGQTLLYSWTADGELNYEFHGQIENDTSGAFTSYEKKVGSNASGSLVAAFEGIHGWFFHNKTGKTVTVKLVTSGYYEVKGVIGAPESVIIRSK